MSRTIRALVLTALLLPAPGHASGEVRHSGTIVSVRSGAPVITVEEVGPRTKHGQGLSKRTNELTPTTDIRLVTRSEVGVRGSGPGGSRRRR